MPQVPSETTMKLTDAKQQLSRVVNRVARGETRVVIEKSGLPVAAIISAEEYRRFTARDEAERQKLQDALVRFSQAFDDIPEEELARELARAQARARAELRAVSEVGAGG